LALIAYYNFFRGKGQAYLVLHFSLCADSKAPYFRFCSSSSRFCVEVFLHIEQVDVHAFATLQSIFVPVFRSS
jgi:hypothetical protein